MLESEIAFLLADLGRGIRRKISSQRLSVERASRVAEVRSEDTIFALDRHVEPFMLDEIANWPPEALPVNVFAEGVEGAPVTIGAAPGRDVRWHLLIDPIDGTRGLMMDKRPAYFLAAAAPGAVRNPRLSDAVACAAVELPTSKQSLADVFTWYRGGVVSGLRESLADVETTRLDVHPSTAISIQNGFGSVVAYFPHGKSEAAGLAWKIALAGGEGGSPAQVFDDQFISSGGQLLELLCGRDRYVIDLRAAQHLPGALCAHPYDLAIAPMVIAGGVILTDMKGRPFDAPFALTENVGWCGYANLAIQQIVEPVVLAALIVTPSAN